MNGAILKFFKWLLCCAIMLRKKGKECIDKPEKKASGTDKKKKKRKTHGPTVINWQHLWNQIK